VLLTLIFLLSGWFVGSSGQGKSARPAVVTLPKGEVSRIQSPDGEWTLIFECLHECTERKLWIEDNGAHERRLVRDYERSLSISWAPDSRHFFVNDLYGSNGGLCSAYDTATLKTIDMAELLVARDAGVRRFLDAGHSYLQAKRWIDSHELLIVLFGHFDDPPLGGFTLRYRVDLTGNVHKLSQQSEEHPQ